MSIQRRTALAAAAVALATATAGCTTRPGAAPLPEARPAAPATAPVPADTARPASFDAWRAGFRERALARGIRPEIFDRAFRGVRVNEQVLELDRFQPEFTRPIWEYLDSAVSPARVATGREKAAELASLLDRIEQRYGVDREVILAIWGLESAYGANYGSIPVIESLATLAYEGRRQNFAEAQLLAALEIIQSGDVEAERMVGSWAGAMGHTQFIPTSFLDHAVDFTGDGRRDVWDPAAADALASTANYLSHVGWEMGAPAVVEVRLPSGFDYLTADDDIRRPATAWEAAGIAPISGGRLPASEAVSILLPAGAEGPAFAVYPNFRVIKRYNNATSYALAVAHLADRIRGAGSFAASWPRGDRGLNRAEAEELQRRLTALGYDTGGADGIIGPNTRAAVRNFQSDIGRVPDGYVSAPLLSEVRSASDG